MRQACGEASILQIGRKHRHLRNRVLSVRLIDGEEHLVPIKLHRSDDPNARGFAN